MLRWLYNLIFGYRYDYYHPGERKLYRYFNGQKMVTEDPMILYKKIMDVGPEMDVHWKLAMSPSKDARVGHNDLVTKIRQVFSVPPLTEGGLTETEAIELLTHFMTYTGMIKKNSLTSATSAEVTSPTSESSSTENPATPKSSASGSTDPAPVINEPVKSPLEPPLPSAPSSPEPTTS